MNKWLTFVVLIPGMCAAQETMFESNEVVLVPPRDKTIPLLKIHEPQVDKGGKVFVASEKCFLRGSATDIAGIRAVDINGVVLSLGKEGQFDFQLALHEGLNPVKVTAEDSAGNRAVTSFDLIRDTRAPVITVLEPRQEESRGIRPLGRPQVLLKARITDEYGVRSVSVNGTRTSLDADSTIAVSVQASEQDTKAIIAAEDYAGNLTRREVIIPRVWRDVASDFLIGKTVALVIGIDKYHGTWDRLQNAVRDAKAVEEVLRTSFRFDTVFTLYDEQATRDNIIGKLDELAGTLNKNDNFLIYYSGHGYLQEHSQRGFWVPADADGHSTARYISHADLKEQIAAFQVHHLLLIADACFSGELLTRGNTRPVPSKDMPAYLRKVFQPPSRYALTSGGVEPVLDGGREGHSIFTYYLIKALTTIEDSFFSPSQVYERLKIGVGDNSPQMPLYREIRDVGSESGEFIFVRK